MQPAQDQHGIVGVSALYGNLFTTTLRAAVRGASAAAQNEDEAREREETEARIQAANEEMKRARRSRSLAYFGFRLLLGAALVSVGLVLAAGRLKEMAAPAAGVLDALVRQRVPVVLVAVAIALIDVVLDFRIARPLIGDGLPQLAVLLAGIIVGRSFVEQWEMPPKLERAIARLEANKELFGLALIALGVIHISVGAYPIV